MPRALVATAPRSPELIEYEELELKSTEVRIKSIFSAVKHGTELRAYRANTLDVEKPFDSELGLHVRKTENNSFEKKFPMNLGNVTVGEVIEVGHKVDKFRIGDPVYGSLSIRETHTVESEKLELVPQGMDYYSVVCWDPVGVALSGIRDSGVGIGDSVLVIGLGAIGQFAIQLARLQGASWVAGSDISEKRRNVAKQQGVDIVFDPDFDDVGLEVKKNTSGKGVDVVIEASGSYPGLNDAIRAASYAANVVSVAYYHGDSKGLRLEGEWHRNRINLLSSRDVSAPHRLSPRWNASRLHKTAFELLHKKSLNVQGILDPIVSFRDSVDAYRQIDENPLSCLKLGVTYS